MSVQIHKELKAKIRVIANRLGRGRTGHPGIDR